MSEYDYGAWKSQHREKLEAFEGEGPPTTEELWGVAEGQSAAVASWIQDMPPNDAAIETAKGDLLKALVALEMAEERLDE